MRLNKMMIFLGIILAVLGLPQISWAGDGSKIYWVSPTGAATWTNCESNTPLEGTAACSLATANSNAVVGDIINMRGGTYRTSIHPSNSGTSGNMIVYQAYPGETPIISGHNQWGTFFGIFIEGKNYIKVTGVTIKDVDRWMLIRNGASHNEIAYCLFDKPVTVVPIQIWKGQSWMAPATHNWFHHNTVRNAGNALNCNDNGYLMSIGVPAYDSESHYNAIENNIFYYGGHHLVETYTMHNVIRNNVMHNEGFMDNPGGCPYGPDENGKYGNRNIQIYDGYDREGVYNLIEGNRFGNSGPPPDDDGGDGFTLTAPKNIVRYNAIFNSQNNGILMKMGASSYSNNNRIYNNTIYKSGRYKNTGPQWQGFGIRFYPSQVWATGNVIKNNLLYDNKSGDFVHKASSAIDNTIVTNWLHSNGDPLFVNPDVSDPFSLTLPNLNLQAFSGAINRGVHLTQSNNSGVNSTTLVVDDALYFQDGTWGSALSNIQADWIAIGTVNNVVQISSINYSTNTITLASPMTWADNAPIWLYKNSSGERVLFGTAPDMGAHEYVSVDSDTTPPAPPTGVTVQ